MCKKSSEKQAPERWIFPKELKGVYTDGQLKYFIGEAETRLQDSVRALINTRERYYTVINILLLIIGVICTILFTCPSLGESSGIFLLLMLIFLCIVTAFAFFRLKHYIQYGPGFKPKEFICSEMVDWINYAHGTVDETSCLILMLEQKQRSIDLNQVEINRQVRYLRIITVSIAGAVLAAVLFLTLSFI